MHFATIATLVLGALSLTSTSGAPIQKRSLEKRADVQCRGGATNSQWIPVGSGFGWRVFIPQPIGLGDYNDNTDGIQHKHECGSKFLDYIRAQGSGCESTSSWTCDPANIDGVDGIMTTFDTNIFCGAGQIQKAIWDSTSPQLENTCINEGNSGGPPSTEDILGAVFGALGGVGRRP